MSLRAAGGSKSHPANLSKVLRHVQNFRRSCVFPSKTQHASIPRHSWVVRSCRHSHGRSTVSKQQTVQKSAAKSPARHQVVMPHRFNTNTNISQSPTAPWFHPGRIGMRRSVVNLSPHSGRYHNADFLPGNTITQEQTAPCGHLKTLPRFSREDNITITHLKLSKQIFPTKSIPETLQLLVSTCNRMLHEDCCLQSAPCGHNKCVVNRTSCDRAFHVRSGLSRSFPL